MSTVWPYDDARVLNFPFKTFYFIILNYVYVSVSLCGRVSVRAGTGAARGIGSPGAEVTGSCEPHTGAGNGVQILPKSNILS